MKIINEFSVGMLADHFDETATVQVRRVNLAEVKQLATLFPVQFHTPIGEARVLARTLGVTEAEMHEENATIGDKEVVIMAKFVGPRLRRRAVKMPKGTSFIFFELTRTS